MCAKTIAFIHNKGGVGKTTATINLGAALASEGKRVLLADNDPQGSLSTALGIDSGACKITLANLMYWALDDFEIPPADQYIVSAAGMDVIPANNKLSAVEQRLVLAQGMLGQETESTKILKTVLEPLTPYYDYILIDCRPSLDHLIVNALAAADSVIIPVKAHFLSLDTLRQTLELIAYIRKSVNPALQIEGILLTMYQEKTNLCRGIRQELDEAYGMDIPVFDKAIDYSIKVAELPAYGQTVYDSAETKHFRPVFTSLANEVMRHAES